MKRLALIAAVLVAFAGSAAAAKADTVPAAPQPAPVTQPDASWGT